MGFQLWFSEKTKIARRGTTFAEMQQIFIDNITTKLIYEPLACCRINDNVKEVKTTMNAREFDTIGVIDEKDKKLGYIKYNEITGSKIANFTIPFTIQDIISDSTPISDLLDLLEEKEQLYVIVKNSIEGIVTRADINKPIIRIYLFGIISLFELHLNFWITQYYPEEVWRNLISNERFEKAKLLYELRKGNNSQLSLLECLQLCDKKSILVTTDKFMNQFTFTKSSFKKLLENCETLRNEIAHSQNSIILNLEWKSFVMTIASLKKFLDLSEKTRRNSN